MTNIPLHREIQGLPDPVALDCPPPTVRHVLLATALTFGVSATRMVGLERHRVLLDARLAAAYLAQRITLADSGTVAKILRRDAASVRWAARKAVLRAESDAHFRELVRRAADRAMELAASMREDQEVSAIEPRQ